MPQIRPEKCSGKGEQAGVAADTGRAGGGLYEERVPGLIFRRLPSFSYRSEPAGDVTAPLISLRIWNGTWSRRPAPARGIGALASYCWCCCCCYWLQVFAVLMSNMWRAACKRDGRLHPHHHRRDNSPLFGQPTPGALESRVWRRLAGLRPQRHGPSRHCERARAAAGRLPLLLRTERGRKQLPDGQEAPLRVLDGVRYPAGPGLLSSFCDRDPHFPPSRALPDPVAQPAIPLARSCRCCLATPYAHGGWSPDRLAVRGRASRSPHPSHPGLTPCRPESPISAAALPHRHPQPAPPRTDTASREVRQPVRRSPRDQAGSQPVFATQDERVDQALVKHLLVQLAYHGQFLSRVAAMPGSASVTAGA